MGAKAKSCNSPGVILVSYDGNQEHNMSRQQKPQQTNSAGVRHTDDATPRRRRWRCILCLIALAVLLLGWGVVKMRRQIQARRRLAEIGEFTCIEYGPKWYLKLARKWSLPVPKRVAGFDGCPETNEDLRFIATFRSLRSIRLCGDGWTDQGVAHLTQLRNLESLALISSQITNQSLCHLARLTRLRYVALAGNMSYLTGTFADYYPPWTPSILKPSPISSRLMPITNARLQQLSSLKHLRNLELYRTTITTEGAKKSLPQVRISPIGSRVQW